MSESHAGGCLCGAVRYEIDGSLRSVFNCHCAMCRRFHGHYGAYSSATRDRLRFTGAAQPSWYESSPIARRGFCAVCGTSLFWERKGAADIAIAAGSLDFPSGLTTEGHIFCADKGDYYEIVDGLAQWPGSKFS